MSKTTRHRKGDARAEGARELQEPSDTAGRRDGRRGDARRSELPEPVPSAFEGPKIDVADLEALASMDPSELAALMEGGASGARAEAGTRVTGTITRLGREHAFVDIGGKSEGQIRVEELEGKGVGEEITAYVLAADEDGVHLSRRLSGSAAASFLVEAAASGVPVEGRVASRNPGGFEVRIGSVRAFCPASQIDRSPGADPDSYIGGTYEFKVIEAGDDVVVSRRAAQEAGLGDRREAFWKGVKVGDVLEGVVTSVQPWGAFVDLDGVEGLVHKSELSWDDVSDATTSTQKGQRLQVRVIDVDHEAKKLSLSAKDPDLSPWNRVGAEFIEGGTYPGRVTGVADFGAFVELAPGLQGLLHVSRAGGAKALPKSGDTLTVRLDRVDRERRRLELSSPDHAPKAEAAVAEVVEGVVRDVLKNGVVLDLTDGRTGWLPASATDLPAGTVLAQRYRVGRKISARVVQDEPERRRVVLTQLAEANEDAAWQQQSGAGGRQTFGTFGDLLGKWKK